MQISVSGYPGSGNSTIAKKLAKELGYKHYSAGDIRRKMAQDRDITLAELNKIGETEDWTDVKVDKYIETLSKTEDNFVTDAKIGYQFLPKAFKIFLKADLEERAKRLKKDARKEEQAKTLEEAKQKLLERQKSDRERYKKYYDLDFLSERAEKEEFDLVVDTTDKNIEEVFNICLEAVKKEKADNKNI